MSFYAVCFPKEREFKIFDNWKETQGAIKGRQNFLKGFDTEDEAQQWLDELTTEEINKRAKTCEYWANKKKG